MKWVDIIRDAAIAWLVGAFLGGVLWMRIVESVRRRRPVRLLLGIRNVTNVGVVIGVPMGIVPGETRLDMTRGMPIFGFGPLMAYNRVRELMYQGFRQNTELPLFTSRSFPADLYGGDLILIGFPLGNEVTRRVMDDLTLPLRFSGHNIVDSVSGEVQFAAVVDDGEVTKDFGLLARVPNPYSKNSVVFIFAGSETYGVKAAADYLSIDNLSVLRCVRWPRSAALLAGVYPLIPGRYKREFFEVIVSTRVRGLFTSRPEVEVAYFSDGKSWQRHV